MVAKSTYTNEDLKNVVDIIQEVSFYLDLDPDISHWEVRAYRNAADSLESSAPEMLENPKELDGIGSGIAGSIKEFLEYGSLQKLEDLKDKHADLSDIMKVEGIGPKTAMRIYETLDITTLDELEEAGKNDKLTQVKRVGSKTQANILDEIQEVHAGAQDRKPWSHVESYWEGLSARIGVMQDRGFVGRYEPAGSFRRKKETVGDLDVIIESSNVNKVFDNFENWYVADKILMRGDTKMAFRVDNVQIDVRVIEPESYGACLLYFTGNTEHNVKMRQRALDLDMTLNEYGLYEYKNGEKGKKLAGENEEDIYDILGFEFLAPENRQPENL